MATETLTEGQKFEVERVFINTYENHIKPDLIRTMKEVSEGSINNEKRITSIERWLGKMTINGRTLYIVPTCAMLAFAFWLIHIIFKV